jgi:hypothetical protein
MTWARGVGTVLGRVVGSMIKGFLYGAGAWVAFQMLASFSGGMFLLCFGNGCP